MHALNLNDFDSKVHKWPSRSLPQKGEGGKKERERESTGTSFLAVFCLAFFIFISHFPTYVAIAFGEMFCNF